MDSKIILQHTNGDRVFNQIVIIVISVYLFDFASNVFYGLYSLLYTDIIAIACLFLFKFNLFKNNSFKSISVVGVYFFINYGILSTETMLGDDSGCKYYFFPALISTIFLRRDNETKNYIYLSLLVTIVGVVISFINNDWVNSQYVFTKREMTNIHAANLVISVLATLYLVYTTDRIKKENIETLELLVNLEKDKNIQKDNFLKEINHRVKNNLSIIMAFMRMEKHALETEKDKEVLSNLSNRVFAMSKVHELTYNNNIAGDQVDLKQYISELIQNIIKGYNNHNKSLLDIEMSSGIYVPIEQTMNLGLILNEIVTNVFKHAMPAKDEELRIYLNVEKIDAILKLIIHDNGRNVESYQKNTGLELIEALINQCDGEYEFNSKDGFKYEIKIPV